ncbi:MAG TPA: hypothetical protein VE999_18760 [Gemmataceae bacterium]|nr:hypothetical protein [Gemmataceae bacterium]
MLILHAGLVNGRLLLWGERPSAEGPTSTPRRGGRKAPRPKPSPFDPGADKLASTLADSLPGAVELSLDAESRFVWLPTLKGRPVPSSALN